MFKLELKMHSVILFLEEAEKEKNSIEKKLLNINKTFNIKNVDFKNLKDSFKNCEFIFTKLSIEDISLIDSAILAEVKNNNFNFIVVHKKEGLSLSKNIVHKFINHDTEVSVIDYDFWLSCHYDGHEDILLIGDVHENIDDFKDFLKLIKNDSKVVLLGDYLDKGYNTEKTIFFIEHLMDSGVKMIVGNHESYVVKRLKGEIPAISTETKNFSSLDVLFHNEKLANKVIDIFNKSLPFFSFERGGERFYATHAPCEEKFLGKLSNNALKAQRNFYFKDRTEQGMKNELNFLLENEHKFYHIFGHVAHKMKNLEINKRIWLDTGAVYGNKLTGVYIDSIGNREYLQMDTKKLNETDLFSY